MSEGNKLPLVILAMVVAIGGSTFAGISLQKYLLKLRGSRPVAAQPAPQPGTAQAAPVMAGGSIAWESSFENAMQSATDSRRLIMANFYTDWCPACKSLDANVFPAGEVVAESQNFVNIRIDAEARADLAQQFGVTQYPTIVFMDANGNTVSSFVGGKPPAEFAQFMRSARGG